MTEQNLIINGVDHAKFDLEWAKRGGVFVIKPKYMEINDETMRDYEFFYTFCAGKVICINDYDVIGLIDGSTYVGIIDSINNDGYFEVRMATPSECAEEGVEYIEPPMRWRPIETAPESTYTWPWCQDDKPDKLSERDWECYEIKVSRIIACDSDGFVTEAYNWFGKWYYIVFSGEFHKPMEIKPVKWMPLPPPPKDE